MCASAAECEDVFSTVHAATEVSGSLFYSLFTACYEYPECPEPRYRLALNNEATYHEHGNSVNLTGSYLISLSFAFTK